MKNRITDQANDHDAIWLLIPWYVNGRIDDQQRLSIDAHLRACLACQEEVLTQRKICQSMATSNPDIEQLPTASLRKLWQKIDSDRESVQTMPASDRRTRHTLPLRWYGNMAASLAAIVVAILGFVVFNRTELARNEAPASYYTVTSPAPRIPGEVIRAVFAPTVAVAEMQNILNDAQLTIVGGPTPAGVYSLARTSVQPVMESLQHLRQHKEVLFAEPAATTSLAVPQ